MKRHIKNNVYWLGKLDWELTAFHGDDYVIRHGSSQNAYLIKEEKTVLIDTVWKPHSSEFLDNLKMEINLADIDYIIANHGEVDHSGGLPDLLREIPGTPIYCTQNAVNSLTGQYHHPEWNFRVVKTGDTLDIGNGKKLLFIEMRMLHWPDSMATYLTGDNMLFSTDVFGQHYAVEELFNDRADQCLLHSEAMKYYANILNPFSSQVAKKIAEITALNLPIDMIAPSHGAIWRDNPMQIVRSYTAWADAYQEDQVTIVYDSMWGGTKTLAHRLGETIARLSPSTVVKIHNLVAIPTTDKNIIMTDVFKSRAIAVGSPTVLGSIMSSMSGWLHYLKELRFKNKKAAVFGCYGWSGEGNSVLTAMLEDAGFAVIDTQTRCNWNPEASDLDSVDTLAELLCGQAHTCLRARRPEQTDPASRM